MAFYVYMLASQRNGTLYLGQTDNLIARVQAHRDHALPGFTSKYAVTRLVWFETHLSRLDAFRRERQLKKWNRAWKLRLIEGENPEWHDLYDSLAEWLYGPDQDLSAFESRLSSVHPREGGDPVTSPSEIETPRPPPTRGEPGSPPSRGCTE